MKRLTLLFLFFWAVSITAQTNPNEHISSFNMTSFTYKHDKHWLLYVELQERGIEDYSKIDYYEMKGGIGYNINKHHQPFIGIGKYGTYKNNKFYQNELRIWLQYIYSHNISIAKIDHRLRAEKRFFDFPQTNTEDDTERYRYRFTTTVPINSKKIAPKTLYANAFDEMFVGPDFPTFKRNRVFGGLGYVFSDYVNANLGYLWQREFGATSNRNLHFLYFGLNFTFDRLKYNETHKIPVAD